MTKVLLRGFALALGKNENFFDQYYKEWDTISKLRLIRYPYLEEYPPVKTAPDGTKISFDNHKDISLLTVLYEPCILKFIKYILFFSKFQNLLICWNTQQLKGIIC